MGAERPTQVAGLALPTLVTAVVAPVVAVVVAIALSPRFPIGISRRYDLHLGVHADWTVLLLGALLAFVAVAGGERARRDLAGPQRRGPRGPGVGRGPAGPRSAAPRRRSRSGHGSRSSRVAVAGPCRCARRSSARSSGCSAWSRASPSAPASTTRPRRPQRSGIVWDSYLGTGGRSACRRSRSRRCSPIRPWSSAVRARWVRSVTIGGRSIPTWSAAPAKGDMQWVVLSGRAPEVPTRSRSVPTRCRSSGSTSATRREGVGGRAGCTSSARRCCRSRRTPSTPRARGSRAPRSPTLQPRRDGDGSTATTCSSSAGGRAPT